MKVLIGFWGVKDQNGFFVIALVAILVLPAYASDIQVHERKRALIGFGVTTSILCAYALSGTIVSWGFPGEKPYKDWVVPVQMTSIVSFVISIFTGTTWVLYYRMKPVADRNQPIDLP